MYLSAQELLDKVHPMEGSFVLLPRVEKARQQVKRGRKKLAPQVKAMGRR